MIWFSWLCDHFTYTFINRIGPRGQEMSPVTKINPIDSAFFIFNHLYINIYPVFGEHDHRCHQQDSVYLVTFE